jgi:hypothetical protein
MIYGYIYPVDLENNKRSKYSSKDIINDIMSISITHNHMHLFLSMYNIHCYSRAPIDRNKCLWAQPRNSTMFTKHIDLQEIYHPNGSLSINLKKIHLNLVYFVV